MSQTSHKTSVGTPRSRARRFRWPFVLALAVALALPAAALAWAQNYKLYSNMGPDGIALSDFNSGINWNETSFNPNYVTDRMQLTLCDSSYSCYAYSESNSGYLSDSRSISYGRAKCHAHRDNIYLIYVNWCYTRN